MATYHNQEADILYEIMGILSNASLPVIFKGANITRLILKENGSNMFRATGDIDCDWQSPVTMDELATKLNNCLIPQGFTAESFRVFSGTAKSAGFNIKRNGVLVCKIDIGMKTILQSRKYHYGSYSFNGVLVDKVIADKLHAISTKYVYRRPKDMIDLFALSECVSFRTSDIKEMIFNDGRKLGEGTELFNDKEMVLHGYKLLRGVENKPDAEECYERCCTLLNGMFDNENLFWDFENRKYVFMRTV